MAALTAVALSAFPQGMPPVVNGGGATLRGLAGTSKLVTVVFRPAGEGDPNRPLPEDPNLHVVEVGEAHFTVRTPSGEELPYLFASVKEVRVQEGRVAAKPMAADLSRSLHAEEQKVVDRAFRRAKEIFDASADRVPLRMRAAMIMALNDREEGLEYLRSRATSGDVPTELGAMLNLYLAGAEDVGGEAIAAGLTSGDRKVLRKAAQLAGHLEDESTVLRLMDLVDDRETAINAPAARALGRLGIRETIPRLFRMIVEPTAAKGEAAIFALSRLGGDDVVEQAKALVDKEDGLARYRLSLLLYNLGDPLGQKLMLQVMADVPSLAPEAALVLARDGQWDAMQYLMVRLESRYDEEASVMSYRARAAAALVASGYTPAVSDLQEMLGADERSVKTEICNLLAALGDRRQIALMAPLIEDEDVHMALTACNAAIAMARPDFAARLTQYLED